MNIKDIKTEELKAYENNPRNNDGAVAAVAESIKQFGFKVPIIIDKDGVIVCGHTRLKAAKRLKLETVPCIVADDLTPEQIQAFRLADNKTAELAEWDMSKLNEEIQALQCLEIDMSCFGFDMSEFDTAEPQEITEDEVPEVAEGEPVSQLGDIWQLGEHRLICGDSTDALNINILMNGRKADLVFTDPPYGMKKEADGVLNDNLNYDDLLKFNKQWIPLTFDALKDNGSWYCWGIDEPLMDIYSEILKPMQRENKITFRNLITWDKGNGQGQLSEEFRMYPIADEKCLFVMCGTWKNEQDSIIDWRKPIAEKIAEKASQANLTNSKMQELIGHSQKSPNHFTNYKLFRFPALEYWTKWFGQDSQQEHETLKQEYETLKQEVYDKRAYFDNTHDNQNNVWHFSRADNKEKELTGGHATPKPIALCSRAIKSSSREGEIVLDVFGGSGSTLIACEQLNRVCYMCELDPKYCDVIVKRWETLTGKKAERL